MDTFSPRQRPSHAFAPVAANDIRILKHEVLPLCGSCEVRFPDDRPSRYFYFEEMPSRRLRPDVPTRERALEQARALARAERDSI